MNWFDKNTKCILRGNISDYLCDLYMLLVLIQFWNWSNATQDLKSQLLRNFKQLIQYLENQRLGTINSELL